MMKALLVPWGLILTSKIEEGELTKDGAFLKRAPFIKYGGRAINDTDLCLFYFSEAAYDCASRMHKLNTVSI